MTDQTPSAWDVQFGDHRLPERFWVKATPDGVGCWIWTAALVGGYGRYRHGNQMALAYRVAYLELVGPVSDGLQLDHLCRVRACVNPSHLEQVTQAENIYRGECPPAMNARKTSCVNGHEFNHSNTYAYRGGRLCRECRNEANRRYNAKRRANVS